MECETQQQTPTPKVLTAREVGLLIGWPTQRVRRWLLLTGAGEKRGHRVVTSFERLKEHFPEVTLEIRVEQEKRYELEPQPSNRSLRSRQASSEARIRELQAEVRTLKNDNRKLSRKFAYLRDLVKKAGITARQNVAASRSL